MNETNLDNAQSENYQDYITFKPQALIFLSEKATDLVHEHSLIIGALRDKPMTVKEIHNLYFDTENNKHTKAIKTIYRYLEKLEEEGIVIVAGHRITTGIRVAEKLYCRTATIFLSGTAETETLAEEKEEHAKILSNFITTLFEVKNPDLDSMEQLVKQFIEIQLQLLSDLYNSAKGNEYMTNYFADADLNTIHHLTNLTASIGTFIRDPDLLKRLNGLINK